MLKVKTFIIMSWLIIVVAQCQTFDETRFFLDNIDDKEKSRILTEKGIALYRSELEQKEKHEEIGSIQQFFEAALKFDSTNNLAASYLGKTRSFIHDLVLIKISTAREYLRKKKRTEDDNYHLAISIRSARALEPENDDIRRIRETSAPVIKALIDKYLHAAREEVNLVTRNDSDAKKQTKYLAALDYYDRIVSIAEDTGFIQTEREDVLNQLYSIFESKLKETAKKIKSGLYANGEQELVSLNVFDSKLTNHFEKERAGLAYDLYYNWAEDFIKVKNYKSAAGMIDRALNIRKSQEASALKEKIDRINNEDEISSQFTAWLADIDDAIAKNDYPDAWWKIKNVRAKGIDARRADLMKSRQAKIESMIPGMYESAVQLYKAESFRDAIDLLEVIIDARGNFKDAHAYLERAREKQNVLDTYGGETSAK